MFNVKNNDIDYAIYFFSNQKHFTILIISQTINKNYSASFTLEDLITFHSNFCKHSLQTVDEKFLQYINSSQRKISLKHNDNSLILTIEHFLQIEILSLPLTPMHFISKLISLQGNFLLLRENEIIPNNLHITTSDKANNQCILCIYLLSFILLCFLFNLVQRYLSLFQRKSLSLIATKDEMKLISQWINQPYLINFILLYRASRDGDSAEMFHKHCDNKGHTITLILTKERWKFGGYSDVQWESLRDKPGYYFKSSSNVFLFSLNLKRKYPSKGNGNEIYCRWDRGPNFGYGPDISLRDGFLKNVSSCLSPISFYKVENPNEFNGGNCSFIAKEVEVFLVDYKYELK